MKWINRIERKFGRFAIPNLTLFLMLFQGLTFLLALARADYVGKLVLSHYELFQGQWWRLLTLFLMLFQGLTFLLARADYVGKLVLSHYELFQGQWWRLLTLLFLPPMVGADTLTLVLVTFYFLVYYMIGRALESRWGDFRYNLYILIGYIATVLVVLIPGAVVTNFFLMESVFLAFAWLYPDYEFLLFLILPVKVKWLALIGWAYYVFVLIVGDWQARAEVAAGTVNFLLFFHSDLIDWIRSSNRKFRGQMAQARARDPRQPMHVCAECGVTDLSDRKMEFRYCPLCRGTPAYCINHIHNHKHR